MYNSQFRLLKFHSGYRKFHLNSLKGFSTKIFRAQTVLHRISNTDSYVSSVKQMSVGTDPVLDVSHLPICPTIATMVIQEAILNPVADIQPFVDQLFIIEKLMVSHAYKITQRFYFSVCFCKLFIVKKLLLRCFTKIGSVLILCG